jgi:N-acetylmuramoyl-L-alanine amidase
VLALTGCTPFAASTAATTAPGTTAAAGTPAARTTASAAVGASPSSPAAKASSAAARAPVAAATSVAARGPVAPAPVVVLDPGHNGGNASHPAQINALVPDGAGGTKPCNTTGTATNAGYPEHAFTWDMALRVRSLLTAAGVRVVLSRPSDTGVGPCVDVRGRLGARVGAAAFVGIHGDGAPAGGRGFHVITSSLAPAGPSVAARSSALAHAVRDAMTAVEPVSNYLGVQGLDARRDLAGLNLSAVPAIYLECGNMRNAADAARMTSPAGRAALARRLAAGILVFLGR